MGILARPVDWLRRLAAEDLPAGFHVCELGDQYLTQTGGAHRLAQEFYLQDLGAGRYVSLDGNGRGTHCVDLNIKPQRWDVWPLGDFDLVTDFGTGEHVFNQAQVWATIHQLTRVGGYLVLDRPAQGYPGHCYYRVDECLIRDVAAANAYDVVKLEKGETSRGELWRAILRRTRGDKFRTPQQGRYRSILRI